MGSGNNLGYPVSKVKQLQAISLDIVHHLRGAESKALSPSGTPKPQRPVRSEDLVPSKYSRLAKGNTCIKMHEETLMPFVP